MSNGTTTLPTVARRTLPGGKYRYTQDGEVHTKASTRLYTHASVYRRARLSDYDRAKGREVGDLIVFLHARADLAAKGSPDANRIVTGSGDWARVPGVVTIEEAS